MAMKKLHLKEPEAFSEASARVVEAIIDKHVSDVSRQGVFGQDTSYEATTAKLRSFVERIERLKEEQKALASDMTELLQEVKSEGFDVPTVKNIIKLRAEDDPQITLETLKLYCERLEMRWPY
jgi:uncharacterized protein (UPF0335 family)